MALENPALFADHPISPNEWSAAGITVGGVVGVTTDPVPTGARVLASRPSPTVAEIVRTVSKESHNLGAEALLRLTGVVATG